jgi:hypothetical protein
MNKGQLPTCYMITSKVVDYVNVLNPQPLHAILAQHNAALLSHPLVTGPTQREV